MAIAKRHIDLWAHVQKGLLEDERPPEVSPTVTLVGSPVVSLRDVGDYGWHNPVLRTRAEGHLAALDRCLVRGRRRSAARHRTAWLRALHNDRIAFARDVAARLGFRFDPMGQGPLLDMPTVHYRDKLPWQVFPLSNYADPQLPYRAASIVDRWNDVGEVFDRYYLADEPRTTTLPTHSLIGAISTDGRSANWFALDRWAT